MVQKTRTKQPAYKSRNQRQGKKLFEKVSQYSCYENNKKLCTTARNFIRQHNYKPPCIVTVLKYNGQN
ncbi:DUF3155 domain-containing protein [Calothrix sp. CCY 0018]|uniref:DUF3155 domain-containing protein n=1 Tax=Calothrix sp. CCY 0018 TaxID=3103864 RepID=UPI0039C65C98